MLRIQGNSYYFRQIVFPTSSLKPMSNLTFLYEQIIKTKLTTKTVN